MENCKYEISIIIPVYNNKDCLNECISSLFVQSLDFEKIEVILIDSGSNDGSIEICEEYARRISNIHLLCCEDKKLSSVKNFGISRAEGKYIAFLNPNDKISAESLENICIFFNKHYNEIDLITYPIIYKDCKDRINCPEHQYFEKTNIYDLKQYPYAICTDINICVKNKFEDNILFDTNISIQETLIYNNSIIDDKWKIGYVKEAEYRCNNVSVYSAIIPENSFEDIVSYYENLFSQYENIPKYYQGQLFYNIICKYRFNKLFPCRYKAKEMETAQKRISNLILKIDLDVILGFPYADEEQKLFWLNKRNDVTPIPICDKQNFNIVMKDRLIYQNNKIEAVITDVCISGDKAKITGLFKTPLFNFLDYPDFLAVIDNEKKEALSVHNIEKESEDFGWGFTHILELNYKKCSEINFIAVIDGFKYDVVISDNMGVFGNKSIKIYADGNFAFYLKKDMQKLYFSYVVRSTSMEIQASNAVRLNVEYRKNQLLCNSEKERQDKETLCFTEQSKEISSKYPYMISIIMAVYNTGFYLREALDSLIGQDISELVPYVKGNIFTERKTQQFDDVYEVILIDDGSTDNSGEICDEYAAKYQNFKVIHKENEGVSSARNLGHRMATGKYLNFMDSDDKFSENVFEVCFKFMEENYDKTDIVSFPLIFFEGQVGEHWLNTKFKKGNRVIDLRKEYSMSTLTTSGSFIKAEAMKDLEFDTRLVTCEDAKLVYTIMSEKETLGVVSNCIYWYRRRLEGTASAVQQSDTTINFYREYMDYFIDWIIEYSKNKFGNIPNYMQYLIAQQLQWRFWGDGKAKKAKSTLSEEEFKQYKKRLFAAFDYVDDNIIMEQEKIYAEHKNYILSHKYCELPNRIVKNELLWAYYGKTPVFSFNTRTVRFHFVKIENSELKLGGILFLTGIDENTRVRAFLKGNDVLIESKLTQLENYNSYTVGDIAMYAMAFEFNLKLQENVEKYELQFICQIGADKFQSRNFKFENQTTAYHFYINSQFYSNENWAITCKNSTFIVMNISGRFGITFDDYENAFEKAVNIKYPNNVKMNKALELRKKYLSYKKENPKKDKPIWLICDRINKADDNGETLFWYLYNNKQNEIDCYFIMGRGYKDTERFLETGKLVYQNSYKHKWLLLNADIIISSHAEYYIRNPFTLEGTTEIFRDLIINKKYVFLQHGITKDNISAWLNNYNKGLAAIITAAVPERESFLKGEYCYQPEQIWLTGFPRYDRLYDDSKNLITIMPTWRKSLNKPNADGVGINGVSDKFKDSEYFWFYNNLINNEKLLSAAQKYGYKIAFMPHPNISNSLYLFNKPNDVMFYGTEESYCKIYAESSMVITDYSSSAIDFAYLRKPLVYCQFDKEDFFGGSHSYEKGYYDYERDGFGEVTYNMEELVDTVVEYMKNGCVMKDLYKRRCDEFFAFNDKDNCKRVYERLINL